MLFTDGWEFDMQTSEVSLNKNMIKNKTKYIQTAFITNIEAMLQSFIGIYELEKSSLKDVFLKPSSQLEDNKEIATVDMTQMDQVNRIDDFLYQEIKHQEI